MEKTNRPRGRQKKVTEGGGNVYKRDESIGTKPVGDAYGYADRKQAAGQDKSLLGDLLGVEESSASSGRKKKKKAGSNWSLKRILSLVVLVVVVILVIRMMTGNGDSALLGEGANLLLSGNASAQDVVGLVGETIQDVKDDAEQTATPASSSSGGTLAGVAEASAADETVARGARDRYTAIKGGGDDVFTIMVYMCGTDLESNYGMATSDLNEMLNAKVGGSVNLLVETGGCRAWKNSVVSSSTNQIYQVTADGLKTLENDLGSHAMVDPGTLTDFIKYCKMNFPADRYALIMWDHGGGSLSGYGYDELYKSRGSMPLDKFYSALKNADCKFDFIGFDACLMATLETAVAVEPYADYLIASEETEPGNGWFYTNWLKKLTANSSMATVDIGKQIIDDFVEISYQNSPTDKTTLSIMDLAEFAGTVPEKVRAFAQSINTLVDSDDYQQVADARSGSREFAQQQQINQVDLIHLAKNLGTQEAEALVDALTSAIKYNRSSKSMTNAYGVSVYFPYQRVSNVSNMLSVYDGIGMDAEYGTCIKSFASIVAGGQVAAGGSSGLGSMGSGYGSLLGSLLGGSTSGASGGSGLDAASLLDAFLGGGSSSGNSDSFDYSDLFGSDYSSWFDKALVGRNVDRIAANTLNPERFALTEKDGKKVVSLTEDEWSRIKSIELNVFYDDGTGYLDLGLDNVYDWNDDGDLIAEYDGTWLALNGQVVCYYFLDAAEEGDAYAIRGRVPAYLNGERVDLILLFDDANPDGVVSGARRVYEDGETETTAKGLIALGDGDELEFLCDFYDYNGTYQASYRFGDKLTVNGTLAVSNVKVGAGDKLATYRFTDIYANRYWTPTFLG